MARVKVLDDQRYTSSNFESTNYSNAKVIYSDRKVDVIEQRRSVGPIVETNYPITKINEDERKVLVDQVLPFRVRFINIDLPGYSAAHPAPIGIAIIETNFYVL